MIFIQFRNLNHPSICPIIGLCVEKTPQIHMITPFFKNCSLNDLLHEKKVELELPKRISIAKEIAKGMEYLHNKMICHFHLSSRNIYVDEEYNPYIADYGFHYMKDIACVFIKYKNKNAYSSPEILKDKKKIAVGSGENAEKNDVYSFGILLWELYSCTMPFNVTFDKIVDYVAVQNMRPEIKGFNQNIADLIRRCWDSDPNVRPSFSEIIKFLELIN